MDDMERFGLLGRAHRIWAIASVHGEAARLSRLHAKLWPELQAGDRIVYLGNLVGQGQAVRETLEEALAFRLAFIALPNVFAADLVYLRGAQEEMWQKLLQLQFAVDPAGVLAWMAERGVGSTLAAYGGDMGQGLRAAREGARALSRWTNALREAIRSTPGHEAFFASLRRAALGQDLLFVNAGLDINRPLSTQRDAFWWGATDFAKIHTRYGDFRTIVRGFDKAHIGLQRTPYTATLDAGCGFGGPLLAACFVAHGEIAKTLEA
jgi:serine/threonine protein phosphatase 1